MSYYSRLIMVVLIVIALAQFIPEAVNWVLVLVLASILILQAGQFSRLIAQLKL